MTKIRNFFNELLLNSGQYALFYILMNFSNEKLLYFKDFGHTILLFLLIFQTIFLVLYGSKPILRFMGSLIVPFFYTIIEFRIEYEFIYNIAHIFFWVFSILGGLSQSLQIKVKNMVFKKINEYFFTFLNVITFLFIYFYFDLNSELSDYLLQGKITQTEYNNNLTIFHFNTNILDFIKDSTHIYIILGGFLLALSIAIGRIKILNLNEEIKDILGRYIDNRVRDKVIVEGIGKSEKKELCILFSDIRNFTSLTEKNSPEEIVAMLNMYFTNWELLAKKNNGIIDKFIGDAIMLVFEGENSCNNAINCSLEMLGNFEKLRDNMKDNQLPVIEKIGIGIDFGEVIAGDIGSESRVNYTYIGDTVNTSSRLESLCKTKNKSLIISENVYNLLTNKKNFYPFEEEILLKGKKTSIKSYYFIQ